MPTPKKNRKQITSAILSEIKEKPLNIKEKQLIEGIPQKNKLKLNCTRVLFYIIMFVDIFHDYLHRIGGRGSIIQKIYSFYETLKIILKGIVNITEKEEFISYIINLNEELDKLITQENWRKIIYHNNFNLIYILDKNDFNKPEIKKYKADAKDLFEETGKITNENMILKNRKVIRRSNYRKYKINIEKFDKLFETNGYFGLEFKIFLKVLGGINILDMYQIQNLFSKFDINFNIEIIESINYNNILTNDPFTIPRKVYEEKKQTFMYNGRGIFLSQFLDSQSHFPISLLYNLKKKNKNGSRKFDEIIENFSFSLFDKNNRYVLSINTEVIYDNIKINYGILDYVNSYIVKSNTNGSAATISTGYRYTELLPKFLGDFQQILEAINSNVKYGSGDRTSFLTLFLFGKINAIYQVYNSRRELINLYLYSQYSQKRKRGGSKKKSSYKYKKMAKGKKKTMKGGQDIATPHNTTTGWHFASQPAPTVGSISGNMENYTFSLPTVQAGGSQKVYVKGVGYRKLRYTKTGNRYVIVHGKRKRIK
jgi:hypothetical protein